MNTAAPTVNGESLHTAVVRISTDILAECRTAGLNVAGRNTTRRGSRKAVLFGEGNSVRIARFRGEAGGCTIARLIAVGWTVDDIRASANVDPNIRLLADRYRHLDFVCAK